MSDFSIIVLAILVIIVVFGILDSIPDIIKALRQSDSPCKCKDKTPKT